MGWTNISPTDDQRSAIGTAIKLIHDPYNFERYILFGSSGTLVCDDITADSPVWRDVNTSSQSNANWSHAFDFTADDGGLNDIKGTWTLGTGWQSEDVGGVQGALIVGKDFTSSFVSNVKLTYSRTTASMPTDPEPTLQDHFTRMTNGGGSSGDNVMRQDLPIAAGITADYTIAVNANANYFEFNMRIAPSDATGITLISVVISGTGSNPFDDSGTDGGSEISIADITGSINSQGRFYWLTKRTVSGTDKVFLSRTATYWQNVRSVVVDNYDATLNYSVQTSSYNANVLYITAGAKTYVSTDGGQSVSDAGDTLTTAGGALSVPYNGVASGDNTANASSPPDYMCVLGQSGGNTEFRAIDGSTTHVFTSNKNIPAFGLNGSTIGGLSINAIETGGTLRTSDDGGLTWSTAAGALPSGGTVHGINGLPNRPGAALAFGDQTLAGSDDRGATWDDFWTDYDTFRSGVYGSAGTNLVWAQARLDRYYSDEVTTE